jgi:hypothetical protein
MLSVVKASLERAAAQPSHHEICRIRIAPEIDQRNDVGMFDACHEAGLGFEPSDELWSGRQLRTDLLDRNLAIDRRLRPAPDDREGASADLLDQAVAAEGATDLLDEQRRVASQQS